MLGIFGLAFSTIDIQSINATSHAFNITYAALPGTTNTLVYQNIHGSIQSLSNTLYQFSFFFPDLAAIGCILLIVESWMLSFFIKAHPLAAVGAIAMLLVYTIASFFISNSAITIARLPVFSAVIANAGASSLLLVIWINAPILLVLASVVDIGIAFTASRS